MARRPSKPALTHIDAKGEARMVDVSAKPATERTAIAEGRVVMSKATLDLITSGNAKKGDVLATAPTGGEMEALTAGSAACLTIYDMIKAVERGVRIEGIHLVEKSGGKSGHYRAKS